MAELQAAGEVRIHGPAEPDEVLAFEQAVGAALPEAHRRLLALTDGLEAFQGYLRLFGVGRGAAIDMRAWNAAETWKFAYRGEADPYLCFGELGSGHQFAYRIDELGAADPPAYNLLVNDMSVVFRYDDFSAFLDAPFLHGALHRDADFANWVGRLGELGPGEHVAHRSFGVLDDERGEFYEKMDAVEAMVCYGDAWASAHPGDAVADDLEFFTDEAGRRRLRIVWR